MVAKITKNICQTTKTVSFGRYLVIFNYPIVHLLHYFYSNLTTAFRVIFQPVPSREAVPSSSVMMWRG